LENNSCCFFNVSSAKRLDPSDFDCREHHENYVPDDDAASFTNLTAIIKQQFPLNAPLTKRLRRLMKALYNEVVARRQKSR